MSTQPVAIVAGAGPGLGQALINYLANNGYNAFGLNRSIQADFINTVATDLADKARVESAVKEIYGVAGALKLVIHNPAKLVIAPFEETGPEIFEDTWRTMVLSAVHLAQATLPMMAQAGGGTFIVSGATASLRGGKNFSAFASAKSALRTLTQSLAKEYGPKGIHVAHVILDGILNTDASRDRHGLDPARMMNLDDVAAAYLALANQPQSTWTFEADLRPMGEAF
ncbi:MAG: SDR family NAD(P)-dependent oxidoreductase [Cyanobacteria bacterium P01_F01_bin.150]